MYQRPKCRKCWSLILGCFFPVSILNPFETEEFEKFNYWDLRISLNFKHQQLENHKCKVYQLEYKRKIIVYSFKEVPLNMQFSLTFFEIFLFQDRSVLWPAQKVIQPARVKNRNLVKFRGVLRTISNMYDKGFLRK